MALELNCDDEIAQRMLHGLPLELHTLSYQSTQEVEEERGRT